jgi:hypothetical protein
MKRVSTPRREPRQLLPRLRDLSARRAAQRFDGRVALAVLWAVTRLAQRLGPAA